MRLPFNAQLRTPRGVPSINRVFESVHGLVDGQSGPVRAAVRRCLRPLAVVFGASLAMNLLQLVPPVFMMQVYDRVLTSRSSATLAVLTAAALGMLLVLAVLDNLRNRLMIRIGVRLDVDLHAEVFEAVFRRSLRMPGASQGRALQDVAAVRSFASGPALAAFFDLPWTPFYLLLCWAVHPLLAVVAVASGAVMIAITVLTEALTGKALRQAGAFSSRSEGYVEASLRNGEVIEAMGMLPSLRRRWAALHHSVVENQAFASDWAAVLNAASRWTQQVSQLVTLAVGAALVIEHQISPGLMMICTMVVARGLMPINQIVASWKSFVAARGAAARLAKLLEEYGSEKIDRITLPVPKGAVGAERIVVAGSDGRVILKGISVEIPAGASVGIIGPSGSGKTTLVRALLGLVPLAQGVVRLDGADIASLDRGVIGPSIGYLPQDIELFDGTIAENIARFGPLDSAAIVEAAKVAGMHEHILAMPNGYETRIGEQGAVLSGGQRQRVGLARAVYGYPALVVLDEPNSNLDLDGEKALHGALAILLERKTTVLVVAHRSTVLSMLGSALAVRDGAIAAHGPMSEIMKDVVRPIQGMRA